MQPIKTFTIIIITILLLSNSSFAQEIVEDDNWLIEITGSYCRYSKIMYRFKSFTKDDVAKAKEKFKQIKQTSQNSEWEGLYFTNTGVGDSNMILNSEGGFLRFYCYHYLDSLDYGKINNSSDFIALFSEKPAVKNQNEVKSKERKLVKVKFGEIHFLVPEERLEDFLEVTAGLKNYGVDLFYYWTKEDDIKKEVFGLPIVPSKYKHLLRHPIEAKITHVGDKKIIPNEQSTKEYNFDDIHYPVTINAGSNKNVKIGMDFLIKDTGEWVRITKVSQKSSVGFIRRDINLKGNERCFDDRGGSNQTIACKNAEKEMKVITKTYL